MNFNDIIADFKTRFSTKEEPEVVFAGKPLCLLGEEISDFTRSAAISLSAGTALAFLKCASPVFTVQNRNSNIAYTCPKIDLSSYNEDNIARPVFRYLSGFHGISAMNMLFANNSENPNLQNLKGAIDAALHESPLHTTDFGLGGKKIIIVMPEIKKKHFIDICNKVYDGEEDNEISAFILNEQNRIRSIENERHITSVFEAIKESSGELFSLISCDKLQTIANILAHTPQALAYRPIWDCSSIYIIADELSVDELIKKVESEYEKKAGKKPTFAICDIIH